DSWNRPAPLPALVIRILPNSGSGMTTYFPARRSPCATAVIPCNKLRRHPEGARDKSRRASRRMATSTESASILRDGRAQGRATSSGWRLCLLHVSVFLFAARRRQQIDDALVNDLRCAIEPDRLDAHVVGAGVPMRLHARADRGFVAPGDVGVDKAVGAAAGEIIVGEAEPAPVVHVIVELHIALERDTANAPRLGGI